MSASLVGSEMCIRDSAGDVGRGPNKSACERPKATGRAQHCPRPSRAHSAVSYTHLTLPTICSV
eukprot:12257905-Alexandrium_andersonii.AAC.1